MSRRAGSRRYVVTGSASGIGAATRARLERDGAEVIGVDLREAEVLADLRTAEGRARMVTDVAAAAVGAIDAVVACAGVGHDAGPEAIVRVNHFGAVATLAGLRPLLVGSSAPRAVAVASRAILHEVDAATVDACLEGDEEKAVAAATAFGGNVYACSKRALARWVRRSAPTAEWAGEKIPLNAVAPGAIRTAMTAEVLGTEEGRREVERRGPMPLGGPGEPEEVAELLCWLTSAANSLVTGQVVFVDGGSDVVLRGDDIW